MTIVVLEGPDGSGKTTLARKLLEEESGVYFHSRYWKNQWKLDAAILRAAVKAHIAGKFVVLDRSWIGDGVYGPVFRKTGSVWGRRMDSVLRRFGALYVFCLPPIDFLLREFERLKTEREEMYASISDVVRLYTDVWHGNMCLNKLGSYPEQIGYAEGFKWRDDTTLFDRADTRQIKNIKDIRTKAKKLSEASTEFHKDLKIPLYEWNATGSLEPGFTLLVGDKVANPEGAAPWPFFQNEGSSLFLTKALHNSVIGELRLVYCNVARNEDFSFNTCFSLSSKAKRVVALGEIAERSLVGLGVFPKHAIEHPKHAMKTLTSVDYGRMLEKVIY
jgi:hypothetical protein